jgi:hypothetical protein
MHGHRCNASCMWSFEMFVLTPADGFCCVWFIYPALCWFWFPEIGTGSIDWGQVSKLFTWGRRQCSFSETLFYIKHRTIGNIQKVDNCINLPSSQTFRTYVYIPLCRFNLNYIFCCGDLVNLLASCRRVTVVDMWSIKNVFGVKDRCYVVGNAWSLMEHVLKGWIVH